MVDVDAGLFTVGVFQDAAWAQKALDALAQARFAAESLTFIAKDAPANAALLEKTFGQAGQRFELFAVGAVVAHGPMLAVLQGSSRDLTKLGLSGTMRRVGFQPHDCRIFEALTGRGGVFVSVRGEARVSDALELFLSYGGGNAAIGAWGGRV